MTSLTHGGPAARYRFRNIARMEWIKLRSLRSTWWTLALTVAGAASAGAVVGLNTRSPGADVTDNVLAGVLPGLLASGVLGVLAITGEYAAGGMRATLAAVPDRPRLLAAKACVLGLTTLVAGEVAAFTAFLAGVAALHPGVPAPSLGDPAVLRAVLLTGSGFCLIGLLGLGIGAVIRHTAPAVAVLAGGIYVAAQLLATLAHGLLAYLPISIVGNSLAATRPMCGGPAASCPHVLTAWAGLGMLCLYAGVALLAGGWLLARRDA